MLWNGPACCETAFSRIGAAIESSIECRSSYAQSIRHFAAPTRISSRGCARSAPGEYALDKYREVGLMPRMDVSLGALVARVAAYGSSSGCSIRFARQMSERIVLASDRRAHRHIPSRCAPARCGAFADKRRFIAGDEGGGCGREALIQSPGLSGSSGPCVRATIWRALHAGRQVIGPASRVVRRGRLRGWSPTNKALFTSCSSHLPWRRAPRVGPVRR